VTTMKLDRDICRRAMKARDARFDGRFFIGVRTTGIYCRPICPVRAPNLENVSFYPTAAAAAEAGLRPCLRCRPECSPSTPAWLGSSVTVTRALRLIEAGALDREGVPQLAGTLGIGPRHLTRLFHQHLGASPGSVAQTRRLHLAKKLIDETDLPMSRISSAAGFKSVRRFNDALAGSYGRTPTALRRARSTSHGSRLALRLPFRPPYDWTSLIDFLRARAIPGVEEVSSDVYRRTIAFERSSGTIEVRPADRGNALDLRVCFSDAGRLPEIVQRVRRIFDLDAVPDEIARRLGSGEQLAASIRAWPGLRVPGAWDGFEIAVRAILGQQVTVKGATTLAGRLVAAHGEPIASNGVDGLRLLFPKPATLANAELTAIGLPRARASAINTLARAVDENRLRFDTTAGLEPFVESMTRLPGIGDWTAQYVAMRALGEPDAFPATDLGLLKGAARPGETLTATALRKRAEAWRPWRAYAALHLWKHHSVMAGAETKGRRRRPGKRASNSEDRDVLQLHG